jgi:Na+-transporting NADH:ubiquinone oxidoreductase subunit C
MSETSGARESSARWLTRVLALPKDSPVRTLMVTLVVSFCCAVLVAGTAIGLRPQYQLNQELSRQRNILAAAALLTPEKDVQELFEQVEPRVVDLVTGNYVREIDPATLVGVQARAESARSAPIPRDLDIAFIKDRPKYAVVYLVYEVDRLSAIVLPVYGYGLWSTMYGYIALETDATTIIGLRFYDHGETPGLGGEIDDSEWQRLWRGKKIYGDSGEPLIEVIKGRVALGSNASADHQVDGLTGATLTGHGVPNLLRYGLGEQGCGPYLQHFRDDGEEVR